MLGNFFPFFFSRVLTKNLHTKKKKIVSEGVEAGKSQFSLMVKHNFTTLTQFQIKSTPLRLHFWNGQESK